MKGLFYSLLVGTALSSCTGAETDVQPGGEEEVPLAINSLGLSVGTKSVYDGIGTDGAGNHLGAIGVLVTKGDPKTSYSSALDVQTFTYNGSLWVPDQALNLANAEGTVYAWAPTDNEGLLTGTPKMPVLKSPVVSASQTFNAGNEWDTDQVDYLYGSAAATVGDATHHTVDKWNHTIANLYMQHALAKISFRIMKAEGQVVNEDDYVKRIELKSTSTSFAVTPKSVSKVTMSLEDGQLSGMTTGGVITLTAGTAGRLATWKATGGVADFSGVIAQAYGLAAPAAVGKISLLLTLGPDGGLDSTTDRTYQTKTDDSSLASVTWQKGRHYIYTVTTSDQGLVITNVSVVGWDESVPPVNVPVE